MLSYFSYVLCSQLPSNFDYILREKRLGLLAEKEIVAYK